MAKKKDEPPTWLKDENNKAESIVKTGNEVRNPLASKNTKIIIETESNYLRIKLKPTVEADFRYLVSLRQGEEIKQGNKKPTMGDVFYEVLKAYQIKLKRK